MAKTKKTNIPSDMESLIPCPDCGEYARVILKPRDHPARALARLAGVKCAFYSNVVTCKCGKEIDVSLTINANNRD